MNVRRGYVLPSDSVVMGDAGYICSADLIKARRVSGVGYIGSGVIDIAISIAPERRMWAFRAFVRPEVI